MDWDNYHRLKVIHNFMEDLEHEYPSLCTTGNIGKSLEGRDLKILKISNSEASNACVWIDAGIHAREWIAPAVNTYIANHIARNFEGLPDSVRSKDWYFMPVLNPDGYEYSHTTYRMWRKNKAYVKHKMTGVDLNRNFSYGWGGKGSSDEPQHAFFRGPHPFSEPESAAMRDIFLNSGVEFKVYITLHSFGQVIIMPFACSENLAPDYISLLEGATVMSKAIYDTNGNTYKVGISKDVMYPASGTSNDWSHGEVGIPFCYLIELRSRKHKFKLPKEEIAETGAEILSCVIALMEFIDNYKNPKTENLLNKTPSTAESESVDVELTRIKEECINSLSEDLTSTSCVVSEQLEQQISNNSEVQEASKDTEICSFCETENSEPGADNDLNQHEVKTKELDKTENNSSFEDLSSISTENEESQLRELLVTQNSEEEINQYFNRDNNLTNEKDLEFQHKAVKTQEIDKNTEPDDSKSNLDTESEQLKLLMSRSLVINTEEKETERNSFFEIIKSSPVAPLKPKTQVWELKFIEEGQRHFVKSLDALGAINIWKEEHSTMDVMVEGPRAGQVAGMLHERDVPYTIAIPDVNALCEKEQGNVLTKVVAKQTTSGSRTTMDWTCYHRVDTIYAFLDKLAQEFPYLCTVHVIGKTAEGRDMKMLKISNGGETNTGVWIDGTIHAREWISAAVVTYIANDIVRNFQNQPESVITKDWYILPVLNPDGYEYTHTTDRMWRKSRARYGECVGVDLNRNFSYGWAERGEEGSSEDPGSIFYRGPKAFSEPETTAVKNAILKAPIEFKVYLSFHSYGEAIIFPWGYTSEPCPDYVMMLEGGTAMAKAIHASSGHTYKVGSTKDLMYYASGTSSDWTYGVVNIPFSYMIELRGKQHRFLLPKEEIVPTAIESLKAVLRLLQFVDGKCGGSDLSCVCPK
ncbi:uncharacterized protein LOC142979607 [Anticarsia gemmatalis]|uniref:uncharacterized protein LOC142979607 n=1 Tax=Anticarsia gemmatalis TaxID=129554 RepID=UPI003F75E25A